MVDPRVIALVCSALLCACASPDKQFAPIPETRTLQDIKTTIDHSKGEFYKAYKDRLKTNPSLGGRVVVKLTLAASGAVLQAEIVESTLNDHELENRIKAIFTKTDFGPVRSLENMRVSYPLDFLPL